MVLKPNLEKENQLDSLFWKRLDQIIELLVIMKTFAEIFEILWFWKILIGNIISLMKEENEFWKIDDKDFKILKNSRQDQKIWINQEKERTNTPGFLKSKRKFWIIYT